MPHLGITVTLALLVAAMVVLIYFIHHTAISIQLPQVVASIASDLSEAIAVQGDPDVPPAQAAGPAAAERTVLMESSGGKLVRAPVSGYLQVIRHELLVSFATEEQAVIALNYRPGHFLVQGHPYAVVWPPEAAARISAVLGRAHVTGPYRTLTQDLSFAIDQAGRDRDPGPVARRERHVHRPSKPASTGWVTACARSQRRAGTRPGCTATADFEEFIRVLTAEPTYERLVQRGPWREGPARPARPCRR